MVVVSTAFFSVNLSEVMLKTWVWMSLGGEETRRLGNGLCRTKKSPASTAVGLRGPNARTRTSRTEPWEASTVSVRPRDTSMLTAVNTFPSRSGKLELSFGKYPVRDTKLMFDIVTGEETLQLDSGWGMCLFQSVYYKTTQQQLTRGMLPGGHIVTWQHKSRTGFHKEWLHFTYEISLMEN